MGSARAQPVRPLPTRRATALPLRPRRLPGQARCDVERAPVAPALAGRAPRRVSSPNRPRPLVPRQCPGGEHPTSCGARLVLSHQHGDHFQATGARFYEVVDRLAGRRYDQVVGCSQSVEDFLLYRYGYPAKLVTCVRNGWSGTPIERNGTGQSIICVARFRHQKNHAALVEAVARVRRPDPRCPAEPRGGRRNPSGRRGAGDAPRARAERRVPRGRTRRLAAAGPRACLCSSFNLRAARYLRSRGDGGGGYPSWQARSAG